MPDEEFKLPASSYDLLEQIIKAYGEQDGPATTSDVAGIVNTHPTQISRNNGFLLSVGIISGGKAKEPTDEGRELANAIHWVHEEDVQRLWRQLLRGNEFIEKILSAVKVRRGMERSDLESHIAYTSGKKKTSRVLTGAGAVVDILLVAGFLEDKNGQLVVAGQLETPGSDDGAESWNFQLGTSRSRRKRPTTSPIAGTVRGTPISIQLQIQCSPEDLDEIGPKLKALLNELSRSSEDDGNGGSGD